jgi:hypothetical protein
LYLLRITTLLIRRYFPSVGVPPLPSLNALRAKNKTRAKRWLGTRRDTSQAESEALKRFADVPNIRPDHQTRQYRESILSEVVAPNFRSPHYGTLSLPSLLDSLPGVMLLSAIASDVFGQPIHEGLEHILGEFMLQAVLEQVLALGNGSEDSVEEAFAWGWSSSAEGEVDTKINEMFANEDRGDHKGGIWEGIRQQYLEELLPMNSEPLISHLQSVAQRFPLSKFEGKLLGLLAAIHSGDGGLDRPIMMQLEGGQLEGFSREETKAMLERCGL